MGASRQVWATNLAFHSQSESIQAISAQVVHLKSSWASSQEAGEHGKMTPTIRQTNACKASVVSSSARLETPPNLLM